MVVGGVTFVKKKLKINAEKIKQKGTFFSKKNNETITRHVSVRVCERGRPGKITLCSLLGGTLSFGTFREKRRETLRWNGEHLKQKNYI